MRDLITLKNDPPELSVWAHRLTPDNTCQKDDDKCFSVEDQATKRYRAADTSELGELDAKTLPPGTKLGFSVENKTDQDYYLSEAAIIPGGKTKKLPDVVEFANTGREIIKAIVSKERLDPRAFEWNEVLEKDQQAPLSAC